MSQTLVIKDIGQVNLDRVEKMLAGIPGAFYKAVSQALKRAAQHGLTVGVRAIVEQYYIGQNEVKRNTRSKYMITRNDSGGYEVSIIYVGNVVPLLEYDTRIDRSGRVYVRVLRQNSRNALDHAFVAKMGQHTGVFERETEARFPVRELYGPSPVQAFYAHETAVDRLNEAVMGKYEERLDHEVLRILNGWGIRHDTA